MSHTLSPNSTARGRIAQWDGGGCSGAKSSASRASRRSRWHPLSKSRTRWSSPCSRAFHCRRACRTAPSIAHGASPTATTSPAWRGCTKTAVARGSSGRMPAETSSMTMTLLPRASPPWASIGAPLQPLGRRQRPSASAPATFARSSTTSRQRSSSATSTRPRSAARGSRTCARRPSRSSSDLRLRQLGRAREQRRRLLRPDNAGALLPVVRGL